MTGFFKEKAISQIDKLLINGQEYTDKQIKEVLKDIPAWTKAEIKAKKK